MPHGEPDQSQDPREDLRREILKGQAGERRLTRCEPLKRGLKIISGERLLPIDYYTALWLLNLLYGLAHSDGIFQVKTADEMKIKIDQLHALLNRIGEALNPFAGEEQAVIERVFNLILRRFEVLRSMGTESLESLEGQGAVEFDSAFKRVEDFLDGLEMRRRHEFEMLARLRLPPRLEFSLLLSTAPIDEGELSTYLGLQGSSLMSFYEHEL